MGKKVAILGGGMGALAAAFEASADPENEVDVYQLGWRLGGKCAAGRNPAPQHGNRIEEHGLHVWAGFYHDAGRLLRACFSELQTQEGTGPTWGDAFDPLDHFSLYDESNGTWERWPIDMPRRDGLPGDGGLLESPGALVRELIRAMKALFDYWIDSKDAGATPFADAISVGTTALDRAATRISEFGKPDSSFDQAQSTLAITEIESFLQQLDTIEPQSGAHEAIGDPDRRFFKAVLQVGGVIAKGLIRDMVPLFGFESIDDIEVRAWLRRHGASEELIASPLVRGGYDYVFGYKDGDTAQPSIAAGTAVKGTLRMVLDYRGAFFWRMKGSMAEVVISPIYRALKRRAVKFHFFHRVDELVPDDQGRIIERVKIGVQAKLKAGPEHADEYDPLLPGSDRWPIEPRFELLDLDDQPHRRQLDYESNHLQQHDVDAVELVAGEDFDALVLGIPVSALGRICERLVNQKTEWHAMVAGMKATRTLGVQIWFNRTTAELGFPVAGSIVTAYEQPLATWADLSHLDAVEDWPDGTGPKSTAYFCQAMPADVPATTDWLRQTTRRWLDDHAATLWPNAVVDGGFDYSVLYDPSDRDGPERLDFQYMRVNTRDHELYVQNAPDMVKLRMEADDSGYRNLFLAGDWVISDLNAGAVEAAVETGVRAAKAAVRTK